MLLGPGKDEILGDQILAKNKKPSNYARLYLG